MILTRTEVASEGDIDKINQNKKRRAAILGIGLSGGRSILASTGAFLALQDFREKCPQVLTD